MNSRDYFLSKLRKELIPLSVVEQEQIIDEYISIFEIKKEEGLSDEAIIEELGEPSEIAKEFLDEFEVNQDKMRYSHNSDNTVYRSTEKNTALFVVMILFTVFIGFWVWFSALMCILSLYLASFVLVVVAIGIVASFNMSLVAIMAALLINIGLALLLFAASTVLSNLFWKGTKKYTSWLGNLS